MLFSYSVAQIQDSEPASTPGIWPSLSHAELALMATLMGLMVGLLIRMKPLG